MSDLGSALCYSQGSEPLSFIFTFSWIYNIKGGKLSTWLFIVLFGLCCKNWSVFTFNIHILICSKLKCNEQRQYCAEQTCFFNFLLTLWKKMVSLIKLHNINVTELVALTNSIRHFNGFSFAQHGHTAVPLLVIGYSPVLMGILGHWGDLGRKSFFWALCFLKAQNIWGLLAHPLRNKIN